MIAETIQLKGLIDHEDRNKLNCKRSNLREANIAENIRNQKLHVNNKTGYKGVSYDKRRKKYRATIMLSRKYIHIGYFNNEIIAAQAYDFEARKLFGNFAATNFGDKDVRVQ